MAASVGGIEFNVSINAAGAAQGAKDVIRAFDSVTKAAKATKSQVENADPFTGSPGSPGGGGGGAARRASLEALFKTHEAEKKSAEGVTQHALLQNQAKIAGAENVAKATAQALEGMSVKSVSAIDKIKESFQGLGIVSGAFGGLTAVIGKDFIEDVTLLAARVENLKTVLENVGFIAGNNAAQIGILENNVKALGITTQGARNAIIKLSQSELDLGNTTKLARIAQDSAVIAGINSTEATERLTIAVQRGDSRLLRNLGIVVNLAQVYQDYAVSVGRTVNTLTPLEKRQLILNEVFRKGALIQGTYEASLNDVFKRYTSLERLFEEARVNIGKNFIPLFTTLVDTTTELAKAFGNPSTGGLIASIAVFTTVLGAALAAASGLAVAVVALSAGLGPGALLVTGLAVALAALATSYFNVGAAAKRASDEIEKSGEKAAQDVQRRFEAAQAVKDIQDVLAKKKDDRTAEEIDKVQVAYAKLQALYPKEKGQLKEALNLEEANKGLDVIPKFELDLAALEYRQDKAAESLDELAVKYGKVFGGTLEENRARIKQSIADYGDLSKVLEQFEKQVLSEAGKTEIATKRTGAALANLPTHGDNPFHISQQDEGRAFATSQIESIRGLVQSYGDLTSAINQTNIAQQSGDFAGLEVLAKNTEEAANEAEKQLKLLATERRKIFKDTNIEILDDYEQFLSKQKALTILNEEQIAEIVAITRARGEERAEKNRTDSNKAGADPAETQRKFADAIAKTNEEANKLSVTLTADMNKSLEGFSANLKLAQGRLEEEALAISDLEERTILMEKGIDQDTNNALKRFQKELEISGKTADEAKSRIVSLQVALEKLGKDDPKRIHVQEELALAQTVLHQTVVKQQLKERGLVVETAEIRLKKLRQLKSEEESLSERIATLRGTTALNVLSSVEKLADAQKKAREEVSKFLQEDKLGRLDPSGNVKKFIDFIDKFKDNIAKARPDQLNLIKKVFPEAERQVLKDINRSFEEIDRRTRRFTEDFDERVQEINNQAADLFQSKLGESGSLEEASRVSEKFRRRALEDADLDRKKNEEADAASKKAQEELLRTKNSRDKKDTSSEEALKGAVKTREDLLKTETELGMSELDVATKLQALKDRAIAQAQEELKINQANLEVQKGIEASVNAVLEKSAKRVNEVSQAGPRGSRATGVPAATLDKVVEPLLDKGSEAEQRRANLQRTQDALNTAPGPLRDKALKEAKEGSAAAQKNFADQSVATGDTTLHAFNTITEIFSGAADKLKKQQDFIDQQVKSFDQSFGARFRTSSGK